MTERLAIDLFAGTGGATAALRTRARWRVVSIDIDPAARPDIVADANRLPIVGPVDFLWASPPCTEYSEAHPRSRSPDWHPDPGGVAAVLAAVAQLKPRFWIMENVRGAIPYLGIPVQKVGPWCLWGYFPPIRPGFTAQTHRKGGLPDARARGAVPLALSEAVADALDRWWDQPQLLDLRPFRRHRHRAARRTGTAEQRRLPL